MTRQSPYLVSRKALRLGVGSPHCMAGFGRCWLCGFWRSLGSAGLVLAETDGCLSDLDFTVDAAAPVRLLQNRGTSVLAVG